jgi:hypothetical protein
MHARTADVTRERTADGAPNGTSIDRAMRHCRDQFTHVYLFSTVVLYCRIEAPPQHHLGSSVPSDLWALSAASELRVLSPR